MLSLKPKVRIALPQRCTGDQKNGRGFKNRGRKTFMLHYEVYLLLKDGIIAWCVKLLPEIYLLSKENDFNHLKMKHDLRK